MLERIMCGLDGSPLAERALPAALSSTTLKALQLSGRSVLVVRSTDAPAPPLDAPLYERVVMPLDGSKRAEWVLPFGVTLARGLGVGVVLVSVVPVPETFMRPPLAVEDQSLVDVLVERGRASAEAYLEEQRVRLEAPGLEVRTRVVVSERTGQTLDALLRDEGRSLAVLSAHGSSGSSSWPHGTVASALLRRGSSPVLVLQDQVAEVVRPPEGERANDDSRYRAQAS